MNKNLDTQAIVKPAVFEQAHYDMYLRYQATRHSDGSMANASPDDYIRFLAVRGATPYLSSFLSIMNWPGLQLSISLTRHGLQFIPF